MITSEWNADEEEERLDERNDAIVERYRELGSYTAVAQEFGLTKQRVHAIVQRAGIVGPKDAQERKRRDARIARDFVRLRQRGVEQNDALRQLGKRYGLYWRTTLRNIVAAQGVELTRQSPRGTGRKVKEQTRQIVQRYRETGDLGAVASEFGVSRATVYQALRRNGIMHVPHPKRGSTMAELKLNLYPDEDEQVRALGQGTRSEGVRALARWAREHLDGDMPEDAEELAQTERRDRHRPRLEHVTSLAVWMPPEDVETLERVGWGNRSAGLRWLIAEHRRQTS